MKNKIEKLLAVLLAVCLMACKRELNLGEIEAPREYKIMGIDDKIDVYPSVETTDTLAAKIYSERTNQQEDAARFTYVWRVMKNVWSGAHLDYIQSFDTLSQQTYLTDQMIKQWIKKTNADIGEFQVQVTATEKLTGISCSKFWILNVANLIDQGWILFCNNNGKSQLSWLSNKSKEHTVDYTEIKNLQEKIPNMFQVPGSPVSIANQNDNLITTTSEGIYSMNKSFLQESYPQQMNRIRQQFAEQDHSTALKLWDIFSSICIVGKGNDLYSLHIDDGNVHKLKQTSGEANITTAPGFSPVNQVVAFNKTPYESTEGPHPGTGIYFRKSLVFNPLTHNFMLLAVVGKTMEEKDYMNYSFSEALEMVNAPNLNNAKLLHLGKGIRDTDVEYTAVFYQPITRTSQLIVFLPNGIIRRIREIKDVDLGNSAHFAIHPKSGNLIYSIGSRLYTYDIFGTRERHAQLVDFGQQQIKQIKFNLIDVDGNLRVRVPLATVIDSQLAVTTWDNNIPQNGGAFYLFTVPTAGQPAIELFKSTGYPPIVDFSFIYNE
ncbi:MAG: hypothetical protein K0R59_188 [Sphingobacterium sp.]|jgi:hypothetical protein|nr:hypothetical protein [Sphingobacterium sp.]